MTIGERIKRIRYLLNMSQVAFADKINVSKQTLYKYENDIITNIPSDKIEKIAEIGNVSPAYLMGWEESDVFTTYKFHDIIGSYVQEIGEFLYYHPEHKVLFDSSMEVKSEDIDLAKQMLDRINGRYISQTSNILNAAHDRTDIPVTDEMKKHDDDIMNDDNF